MLKQVMADERRNPVVRRLQFASLNVLQTKHVSCGDAGLALGQAWVADCMVATGVSVIGVGFQYAFEAPEGTDEVRGILAKPQVQDSDPDNTGMAPCHIKIQL